jgi:hypothetical protein
MRIESVLYQKDNDTNQLSIIWDGVIEKFLLIQSLISAEDDDFKKIYVQ